MFGARRDHTQICRKLDPTELYTPTLYFPLKRNYSHFHTFLLSQPERDDFTTRPGFSPVHPSQLEWWGMLGMMVVLGCP